MNGAYLQIMFQAVVPNGCYDGCKDAIMEFLREWPSLDYRHDRYDTYRGVINTILVEFSIRERDYQRLKLLNLLPPNDYDIKKLNIASEVPYDVYTIHE